MEFYKLETTDEYKKLSGAGKSSFLIFNDSGINLLSFSLDGQTQKGVVYPEEGIEFGNVDVSEIYIKSFSVGNSCPYRVWFFGNPIKTSEIDKGTGFRSGQVPKEFVRIK